MVVVAVGLGEAWPPWCLTVSTVTSVVYLGVMGARPGQADVPSLLGCYVLLDISVLSFYPAPRDYWLVC
jgi:hypothetical protein